MRASNEVTSRSGLSPGELTKEPGDVKIMDLDFENTAVCLFAYNRPEHTRQVLEGLARNKIPHLFVFHDGLKSGHDPAMHQKVADLISGIKFCKSTVESSPVNRGLARSILHGVTQTLKQHEAIVVLEDDCVPSSIFMDYVFLGLNRFRTDSSVYSISGYGPSGLRKDSLYDAYFAPLASSWGWATWKDRWEKFDPDATGWEKVLANPSEKARFDLPGNLFSNLLRQQMSGEIDSWAIRWYYTHFMNAATCIWPMDSKIRNIGMDGTGVHSGTSSVFDIMLSDNFNAQSFSFQPDRVFIPEMRLLFQKKYSIPENPNRGIRGRIRQVIRVLRDPRKWPQVALRLIRKL